MTPSRALARSEAFTRDVLGWDARSIAGALAAGNAASVIGSGILSSGMKLGLALTGGWLAGTAAAASGDAVGA